MTDAARACTPGPTRLDRRKARTLQALVDAAVQLIAQGRRDRPSIQEINGSGVASLLPVGTAGFEPATP
jgi:hypothetical protein